MNSKSVQGEAACSSRDSSLARREVKGLVLREAWQQSLHASEILPRAHSRTFRDAPHAIQIQMRASRSSKSAFRFSLRETLRRIDRKAILHAVESLQLACDRTASYHRNRVLPRR